MASIGNVKLELVNHNHKNHTATLKVSYTAYFRAVEKNMSGLRFREKIELWGADSTSSDDYLYTFYTNYFSVPSSGSKNRERTVTVGDDVLDEDWWGTDDIYAKVWITPILPSGYYRKSNEIHHSF